MMNSVTESVNIIFSGNLEHFPVRVIKSHQWGITSILTWLANFQVQRTEFPQYSVTSLGLGLQCQKGTMVFWLLPRWMNNQAVIFGTSLGFGIMCLGEASVSVGISVSKMPLFLSLSFFLSLSLLPRFLSPLYSLSTIQLIAPCPDIWKEKDDWTSSSNPLDPLSLSLSLSPSLPLSPPILYYGFRSFHCPCQKLLNSL